MICLHFGRHCEVLYTSPTQRASNPTRPLIVLLCYIHLRCSFCWKLLNKNLLFAEVKDLADPVVVPVLDLHVRLRKRLVISRIVSNIQYSWQLTLRERSSCYFSEETLASQIREIVLKCGSKVLNFLVQTWGVLIWGVNKIILSNNLPSKQTFWGYEPRPTDFWASWHTQFKFLPKRSSSAR